MWGRLKWLLEWAEHTHFIAAMYEVITGKWQLVGMALISIASTIATSSQGYAPVAVAAAFGFALILSFLGFTAYRWHKKLRATEAISTFENASAQADRELQRGYTRANVRMTGSTEAARLRIAQLRSKGVEIRNEPISVTFLFSPQLEAWIGRVKQWMSETAKAIEALDPADAEMFRTLDTVSPPRVQIPNVRLGSAEERSLFAAHFCQHDNRLKCLAQLCAKHQIGPTA